MAYIGQGIKQGTFKVLDTSGNTYNGSNTTFNLGTQVGSAAQLLVSHDGVIQKAGTDYTLATGGTQITFSTAPASGASIFITEISGAVGGTVTPSDTSVTADKLNSALLTGHTDIGAGIADADLFLVDDGAGGTLRKTAASRIKTYAGFSVSDITGATALDATPADTDEFLISDAGTLKRIDYSYIKGGGNFELITTSSTTSGTSSVTIDNIFSTTYFVYKIFIRYLRPQTNDTAVRMTLIRGNGNEDTSSSYKLVHMRVRSDGSDIHEDDNEQFFKLNTGTYNSEQQGGANFDMTCNLMRTATNDDPAFTFSYLSPTARNNNEGQFITGGGYINGKNSDLNPRGIKLFMSSGNIDRMFVSVYGLKGSV